MPSAKSPSLPTPGCAARARKRSLHCPPVVHRLPTFVMRTPRPLAPMRLPASLFVTPHLRPLFACLAVYTMTLRPVSWCCGLYFTRPNPPGPIGEVIAVPTFPVQVAPGVELRGIVLETRGATRTMSSVQRGAVQYNERAVLTGKGTTSTTFQYFSAFGCHVSRVTSEPTPCCGSLRSTSDTEENQLQQLADQN